MSHANRTQRCTGMRVTTALSALAVVLLLPARIAAHAAGGHPASKKVHVRRQTGWRTT